MDSMEPPNIEAYYCVYIVVAGLAILKIHVPLFFLGSSFNDGTTQTACDLPLRAAGSHPFKVYCECLGATWTRTSNSARDPAVFFRIADMPDTSTWTKLPAVFDKSHWQAKAC
jgi:hypothetical protein